MQPSIFVKNAFKSEMKKDEREAIEGLIKLESGFRGTKNQLSEQYIQNIDFTKEEKI